MIYGYRMNLYIKCSLIFFLFLLFEEKSILLASMQEEQDVVLIVHNIGQGNFIDLKVATTEFGDKVPPENCYKHMIVDMGTKAFKNEICYGEWIEKEQKVRKYTPQSNEKQNLRFIPSSDLTIASPIPYSKKRPYSGSFDSPQYYKVKPLTSTPSLLKIKTSSDQPTTPSVQSSSKLDPITPQSTEPILDESYEKTTSKTTSDTLKKRFISKIKKEFHRSSSYTIAVDTIIVTHPDEDHYIWLPELIGDRDYVGKIILGGLPEKYNQNFMKWIQERLLNNTSVYFLGINSGSLHKEADLSSQQSIFRKKSKEFAPEYHTLDLKEGDKKFDLNIGKVNISLLSVNPSHWQGNGGEILRSSYYEDTNSDSLVVRILYGGSSAILTGDATSLTINRIRNNYLTQLQDLESNILVASHHGASSHESNDLTWIETVNPQYIAISNGHMYGHPRLGAYENFKRSKRLGVVNKLHNVLVSEKINLSEEKKQKNYKNVYKTHKTNRAIFSTLTNGSIKFALNPDPTKIKISSQFEKDLTLVGAQKIEDLDPQKVQLFYYKDDVNTLYISPKIKKGINIDDYELLVESAPSKSKKQKKYPVSPTSPTSQKLLEEKNKNPDEKT